MSGLNSDAKERIKQAVDIVDLVGGYIPLRRQGRMYLGICPWHDDSRPSLQINPDRQTFKCWVCNLGGDIFSFVMQKEGVEFREALEILAEKAGVTLEAPKRGAGHTSSGRYSEDEFDYSTSEYDDSEPSASAGKASSASEAGPDKPTMFRAMSWAVDLFHECLLSSPDAAPARDYLAERGISAESIATYRLGFAPDRWDWLVEKSTGKADRVRTLERVGLLGKSEFGKYYDRFKGRVLFPIRDSQGRPIALGGRVLPALLANHTGDRAPAKYINSPETPLFSKNREFYGLDLARESIAKSGEVLVMEGYTDCIVARQYGFQNVVAVLGTALGENHVRRLRFADNCRVILVLDGDDAGRKRANEVLELFVAAQVDLRIMTLPDDLDPCDFLHQRGAEEFAMFAERAVDALEHKVQIVTAGVDASDTHAAHRALEEILATLAAAPIALGATTSEAHVRQQQLLSRLARQFRVSDESLRGRMATLRRKPQRASASRDVGKEPAKITEPLAAWERELLGLLLILPDAAQAAGSVRVEQFGSLAARRVFVVCRELAQKNVAPSLDRLLSEFEDAAMHSLLVELDEQAHARGERDARERLGLLLTNLRNQEQTKRHREQVAALDERRIDKSEELNLVQRMIEEKRTRQGISKPTDG